MQTIRIAKLSNQAIIPTRKHPEDAGLDIYANGDHIVPVLNSCDYSQRNYGGGAPRLCRLIKTKGTK